MKAEEKKQLIRDNARKVFARNGYKDVTMKDIAAACNISRGGLYLYYASTEEIFLDVLQSSSEKTGDEFEKTIADMTDAAEILKTFLEAEAKEIFQTGETLTKASYEYAFSEKEDETRGKEEFRHTFDEAVRVIEFLIRMGQKQHRFFCEEPHAAAVNMMLVVEGLKICSETIDLKKEEVDREIEFLLAALARKNDKERA